MATDAPPELPPGGSDAPPELSLETRSSLANYGFSTYKLSHSFTETSGVWQVRPNEGQRSERARE